MWFRAGVLTLVLAVSPLSAQSPERSPFTVISDIQYCSGAGKPLLLDVFVPTHRVRTPTPAVLWIHGGGWERGDKNGNSGAQLLAREGFVTASLFYRLSGDSPFPADRPRDRSTRSGMIRRHSSMSAENHAAARSCVLPRPTSRSAGADGARCQPCHGAMKNQTSLHGVARQSVAQLIYSSFPSRR